MTIDDELDDKVRRLKGRSDQMEPEITLTEEDLDAFLLGLEMLETYQAHHRQPNKRSKQNKQSDKSNIIPFRNPPRN